MLSEGCLIHPPDIYRSKVDTGSCDCAFKAHRKPDNLVNNSFSNTII